MEKAQAAANTTDVSSSIEPAADGLHQFGSLRTITSKRAGEVNFIDAKGANDDSELLAEIGYKQELNRHFSTIQVFGVAFSIMGLLPSIASVLAIGMPGGMVSLMWGWLIAGIFILAVGCGMAELASAIPTSGGLYYYTYYYSPKKYKAFLSFVIGNTNSLALVAGLCSITYGLAQEILSIVVVAKDGDFNITSGKTYGVFVAGIAATTAVTSLATVAVSKLQTVSILANVGLIVLFFIVLPIGVANTKGLDFNDGSFIFGKWQNETSWPDGWQFMMAGLQPAIWTIGAFDSCIHMSEEAKNATKAVPVGIISSIGVCWILGFIVCIVIAACMGPNIDAILESSYGSPLPQILFNALGKKWTIAFMTLIATCQFLMGCSILTAISRQIWAFARDDGLMFSRYIKIVNKKLSSPLRATWFGALCALVIGLLCLIGSTASNALFSLAIGGNYVAWMTPNLLRMTVGKDLFRPGAFFMGKMWSPIVNWIAIIFQTFILIMIMFPADSKDITPDTMNYTVVICGAVWIGSIVYFLVYKKKAFHGPKSNLSDEEYADAVGQDVIDQILSHQKSG